MLNTTLRHKRSANLNTTTSGFHNVRVQEYLRDNATSKLAHVKEELKQSYFVDTLQVMCAQQLAHNFSSRPDIDNLQTQAPHLYSLVLNYLPDPVNRADADLPLYVCVSRVFDESYWKRCCMSRWSSGQLSLFIGNGEQLLTKMYGWKQLYLEHFLSDFLLSLRGKIGRTTPKTTILSSDQVNDLYVEDPRWISEDELRLLIDLCAVCRDYVHTIELPYQFTHINWYKDLFSMLPQARAFRLSYGVCNVGTRYESYMVEFTERDATNIRLLVSHHALEKLRLPNTHLHDSHTMAICAGLVTNKSLCVLDLSHNAISDTSVVGALAVLLARSDFPLQALYLSDNNIADQGARSLAEALSINKSLQILHLNQNKISDGNAGDLLVRALVNASMLQELDLGCNRLGLSTATALIEVLPQLERLKSLNLSGNSNMGGGYSQKMLTSLSEAEAVIIAKGHSVHENTPVTPEQPVHTPQAYVSLNQERTVREASKDQPTESDNTDEEFASRLLLSNKHTDLNEPTAKAEGAEEKVTSPFVSSVSCLKVSATGPRLLKAICDNISLHYIDVRRCGFTLDEEQAIARVLRSRSNVK